MILDKRLIIVETPIYRVFEIYNFHQKTLTERYCHPRGSASLAGGRATRSSIFRLWLKTRF
ncbi:hypothetical protein [Nostoc sp.]|uniref:hypothetical protein n=1 Tax=Nostoc sp. TaxID=1180 RepID=UPI002FF7A5E4